VKIVVGSDHAGFPMKAELLAFLRERGHEVLDVGSYDPAPVDFPDVADAVNYILQGVLTSGTAAPPAGPGGLNGREAAGKPARLRGES